KKRGISHLVCEQKHMGSRAVIVICRDEDSVRRRFGILDEGIGICYTRTGRRFIDDSSLESALLKRLHAALTKSGFWEKFGTDWVCMDAELMPWSFKAEEIILRQYAAVGASGLHALEASVRALTEGVKQEDLTLLASLTKERMSLLLKYIDVYHQYTWPVLSVDDLRLAPFHILATEGALYFDKTHVWHMENLAEVCREDGRILIETPFKVVDLMCDRSVSDAVAFWYQLTENGVEGMVVKPETFLAAGRNRPVQPAIKCRGAEYLRIIYGPEYTFEQNLARLRTRSLKTKRILALKEFALGLEGLERFIRREPLRLVHQCVFAILALESEQVDPRL
ncbi:MAG: polynucleotide kinase-phosphatase, partial [Oligoflexales bacterium]|nr:polynucleotide kinase-phosphatase [Oligoflexales bacterium]